MRNHTCYETIPASGKIVVLDVSLDVKVAFRALIENRIKSAPLWDSEIGDYVGMITVSDFINILRHFYHTQEIDPSQTEIQEKYQIRNWIGSESRTQRSNTKPQQKSLIVRTILSSLFILMSPFSKQQRV